MNIPVKTLKSGFSLPVYGMGLSRVGGDRQSADRTRDKEWIEVIQQNIAEGVMHFDTAEGYSGGHSEELLGQAIKGLPRKKFIIASKVSGSNQSYEGILKACQASLKRLQTDYIDLYMLHTFPDEGLPIDEAMKAMTKLVDDGLIKHIGVSNCTIPRFEAAQEHTPHKIVCNQLHYNVQFREVEERGILDYCQKQDIFLVAWKPIQRGELEKAQILEELAKKYGKTWRQVAINWLISQDNVVAIVKASSLDHLKENLGALDWKMEAKDTENIRHNFPDQHKIGDWPLDYPADVEP
jgi:diketogulonate reductase-like aldo/keto reductase